MIHEIDRQNDVIYEDPMKNLFCVELKPLSNTMCFYKTRTLAIKNVVIFGFHDVLMSDELDCELSVLV